MKKGLGFSAWENWLLSVIICYISFVSAGQASGADLELARLFSNGAVLQRGSEIPVWGWAGPGEKVTVALSDYTVTTVTEFDGAWKLKLPPLRAGGPYQMTVSAGSDRLVLNDILVGEVWICSGQSNMEWTVKRASNSEFEIATANWPELRQFNVPNRVAKVPQDRLEGGEWTKATPEFVGAFTAVGYFFGRELHKHFQVPVGLINTTWGGTIVETWTSPESIKSIDRYRDVVEELKTLDLEIIKEQRRKKAEELIGSPIPDSDPGIVNGNPVWAKVDTNRSEWKPMAVPGSWEGKGLTDLDGIVWFATEFQLTSEQAAGDATIHLGPIDDADITWVNGNEIGRKNQYNDPRSYRAAARYLLAGSNLLVVRVEDTGGGGGIYGKPEQLYVETETARISLAGEWRFSVGEAAFRAAIGPNSRPTLLYNGMVHALIPYSFRGAIWYQGESNAGQAYEYRDHFPLMIRDWRTKWGIGDFPFLFVQLANFMEPAAEPGDSAWAELREAQTMTLSLPNTGQTVIIDIGEADDIHPRNKQDVGYRLSLGARKNAYGEDLVASGPMYHSMRVEGSQVRITFKDAGRGLEVRGGSSLVNGFAVARSDRKFYVAEARIEGRAELVVSSDQVRDPVAVRYGWADNPDTVNLYNSKGLPACPFRTDDWPGVTAETQREF